MYEARASDSAAVGDRAGAVSDPYVVDSSLMTLQRIPRVIDPFSEAGIEVKAALVESRLAAVSNLYLGMEQVRDSLREVAVTLATRIAPPQLIGVMVQPDGTAIGTFQVQFDPSRFGAKDPVISVRTDELGAFTLPLPSEMPLPEDRQVELVVRGASSSVTVSIPTIDIGANGLVGSIVLPSFLQPLPVSILAALQDLATVHQPGSSAPSPVTNAELPVVRIGDDDGCLLQYGAIGSVDRFPYGVFFRLIEPRASIVSVARRYPIGGNRYGILPEYASMALKLADPTAPPSSEADLALPAVPPASPGEGQVAYVDRLPVEQPISVDGFRDQMAGLKADGRFSADETRPMAGTLGLGYVLHMSQSWTLKGLGLGNLVYSLPLAPGEQQQVAIFERVETARVTESEFFTEEQTQQQRATADTSTNATFESAFREAIEGHSSFNTESSSSSWGGSLILISGGAGSSSGSGSSSQSLSGQRQTTQQAAQVTHSAAENQAAARRTASRTGMRIATATEAQNLTTKTITNHNHTRALTMQYWEVQRLYDVTTNIDGLTLTVLVPLQVVRFMPPQQKAALDSPADLDSRNKVLSRYRLILKHGDVLAQALPRRYRHGLQMLLQFAADPAAGVDAYGGAASDVIQFQLDGTFLACETISIAAVTDRNTRVGPVRLSNSAAAIPTDKFTTREELIAWLQSQRQSAWTTFDGALALPQSMNRASIVGFEISRSFKSVSYTLRSQVAAELAEIQSIFAGDSSWIAQAVESSLSAALARRETVQLSPADLERALGGPLASTFSAAINEFDAVGNLLPSAQEQYAGESLNGVELPPEPYPVPARQLAPVLRYNEILEIESMAAHVARRTLHYSRAVWASMSDDERAVMLEAYTIGVPPGGVADATQMIPLLNCVENRPLGYFGNSVILPFTVPMALANREVGSEDVDISRIHEALLAYQIAAFKPPRSTIALPTRGVLGEAVLGHCPSAERIDITRFWNWQDSPADTAPAIAPITLPTGAPSTAAGLTAPSALTNLPSLINNVLTAPTPDTALLQALSQAAASQKDFDTSLTGAKELAGLIENAQTTANLARQDALKTTKDLNAQAMATVGNIVGGIYGGNPTAGSSAASSVTGAPQPAAVQGQQRQGQQTQGQTGPSTSGPGAGPGSGSTSGTSGTGTSGTSGTGTSGTSGTGTSGTTGTSGAGTSGTSGGSTPAPPPPPPVNPSGDGS